MTRGNSFLKAAERWISSRAGRFAVIEPSRDPGRLLAFQAAAVKQIDGAIELEQHAAQGSKLVRQLFADVEMDRAKCATPGPRTSRFGGSASRT